MESRTVDSGEEQPAGNSARVLSQYVVLCLATLRCGAAGCDALIAKYQAAGWSRYRGRCNYRSVDGGGNSAALLRACYRGPGTDRGLWSAIPVSAVAPLRFD